MLIEDTTRDEVLFDPRFSRGAVPRDMAACPAGMFSLPPKEMIVFPRSEWDARIDEQEERQSSLEHLLRRTPGWRPLDQNGKGFCWTHSTTQGVMTKRVQMHQPYVRLSAYAVACKLTGFRDDGGWCGLSADFARKTGIPTVDHWPEQSMSRKNDNAATWENASHYKITQDFVDLSAWHWSDANLAFDQLATMLLSNNPCPVDFNWWGHSVLAVRLVRVEKGRYGVRILNSWYEIPEVKPWGDGGFATLTDKKMYPDAALAIANSTASLAV